MTLSLSPVRFGFYALGAVVLALSPFFSSDAHAVQRSIKTKVYNHRNAPVVLKQSKVLLTETFAAPTQAVLPDAKARRSQVRYANRAGMQPTTFVLKGELLCQNADSKPVEAVSVTIILLDPFHQPIQLPGQPEPFIVQNVMIPLAPRLSKTAEWERTLLNEELYEVAIVVTRVRFQDGSVWVAPSEEITDIF